MRTLLFLIAGLLLMAALILLGRLFSSQYPDAPRFAMLSFIALWFVTAGTNMWIGVSKAGYSIVDETPIFPLIFGIPAIAAMLFKWRLP